MLSFASSVLLFDVAGRVLEPIAVIAGIEDVATMRKPDQQGRGEFGIVEHRDPFLNNWLRGDARLQDVNARISALLT